MVNEVEFKGGEAYECEACGFKYSDKETAQRCEEFCKTHNSCSTEITKNSLR